MNYLIFDTETNGLPRNYKAHYSDIDNWPRVVQLAWMLCDENGEILQQQCSIIKPVGFAIPPNMIHGISQERALEVGRDANAVFSTFTDAIYISDAIVAHNIGFDLPIVSAEYTRLGLGITTNNLNAQKRHCTQAIGTNYCKLPGKYGYKWPKLSELHQFLFNEDFDGAHDAMNDVKATARCFFELKRRGVVPA